jgi:MFS family permease
LILRRLPGESRHLVNFHPVQKGNHPRFMQPHREASDPAIQSPVTSPVAGDSSVLTPQQYLAENLRHNFIVNLLDGAFFGSALGFASFVTIIPLFVSAFTESAILIGLIPAIHAVGWQLPQLLTADRVARLSIYKPMVLFLSIHERLPFFGLAIVAWFHPSLSAQWILVLTFSLLIWQGLGGGFTATAWQSMIGKIIPPGRIGTFFGAQSAAAHLLSSGSAVTAGILLERLQSPWDFTTCFLLAGVAMMISWFFLAMTREPVTPSPLETRSQKAFLADIGTILGKDANFRWFLLVRMLSQLGTMAFAFYTVYAVRIYGISEGVIGVMTGVLLATQIVANPLMGWLGDRWGHRLTMEVGILAAAISAGLAWMADSGQWFYLIFSLAGIANVALWTIPISMTLEFGDESSRPAYIGLANTLIAPSTILAPIIGGWLADQAGYPLTFITSAFAGLLTVLVLHFTIKNPRHRE